MKSLILILLGLGSGTVISGAVFAFITVVGVIPRLAQKTNTRGSIKIYEETIIIGGLFGMLTMFFSPYLPIGRPAVVIYSAAIGVFYGCLAVSLAEVLNVIPILSRRLNLQKGIKYFITALAVGKLTGSLAFYLIDGFFKRQ